MSKSVIDSIGEDVENRYSHTLIMGWQIGTISMSGTLVIYNNTAA